MMRAWAIMTKAITTAIPMRRGTAIMPVTAAMAFTISALAAAGMTITGIPVTAITSSTMAGGVIRCAIITVITGATGASAGTASTVVAIAIMTGAIMTGAVGADMITANLATPISRSAGQKAMVAGWKNGRGVPFRFRATIAVMTGVEAEGATVMAKAVAVAGGTAVGRPLRLMQHPHHRPHPPQAAAMEHVANVAVAVGSPLPITTRRIGAATSRPRHPGQNARRRRREPNARHHRRARSALRRHHAQRPCRARRPTARPKIDRSF